MGYRIKPGVTGQQSRSLSRLAHFPGINRARRCLQEVVCHFNSCSLTTCLLQWITLFCNVVVLRWILPSEMGIWGTFLLWEAVLMAARAGIVNAMMRDYPCHLGGGNRWEACRVLQVTAFHTVVSGAFLLIVFLGLTACYGQQGGAWKIAGLCFSIYSPATLYQLFLEAALRGGRQWWLLSRIQWGAMALAVASLVLVGRYGFAGYCLRQASLAMVMAGLFHWLRPCPIAPRWDWPVYKELFQTGLPLFISNYVTRLFNSMGQGAALYLGGQQLLGLYAPVSAITSCLASLPNLFNACFLPEQNFEYGRTGDAPRIIHRALKTGLGLMVLALPMSLIASASIPWVVSECLPSFSESAAAMQIAVMTSIFRCFAAATTCYSTLKAWRPMFYNLGLLGAAQGIGMALGMFCLPQRPLEAIAIGLLLGQMIYIPGAAWLLLELRQRSLPGKTVH